MYSRPIVPDNFLVPQKLQSDEFILKPLTVLILILKLVTRPIGWVLPVNYITANVTPNVHLM